MTIVITGAAGHVGANLVRALLANGEKVRALVHHDRRALEGLDIETATGDLEDLDSLIAAFDGADIVFHAAALISVQSHDAGAMERINVHGTQHVVEACRRTGVRRLIHFSSIEALVDTPHSTPVDEDRPLINGSRFPAYALTKAASEAMVREAIDQGLNAVILNPTAIIGPNDHAVGLANSGLLAVCEGRLWALVAGGFDFVDARDVAQAAIQAARQAPPGARYILGGEWVSLRDLAFMGHALRGAPVPRLIVPLWLARPFAPLAEGVCRLARRPTLISPASLRPLAANPRVSHSRAARELGYRPRPLPQTVEDTLDWFESAKPGAAASIGLLERQAFLGKKGQHD
jgi:dihydroflavonol-4-reductase